MSFIGELTDQRCKVCNTKYAHVITEVIQIRQQLSQESMQQIGVTNMKLYFPSYFCLVWIPNQCCTVFSGSFISLNMIFEWVTVESTQLWASYILVHFNYLAEAISRDTY